MNLLTLKRVGRWHYEGVPIYREDDSSNFLPLDDYFAKDDRVAYYRGIPIYRGEDPSDSASFEVLNTWYAKDKFRVYYCDTYRDSKEYWSIKRIRIQVVKDADPASFRLLSDGYAARDKLHLFDDGKIVPVRDIDSYELLEDGFAKDSKRGYYNRAEIEGSNGESFKVLDAHYAKDKAKIYFVEGFYIGGDLKHVVLESFKVLGMGMPRMGQALTIEAP